MNKYLPYIFILLLILGWFYWFQFRPNIIRQECVDEAVDSAKSLLKQKADLETHEIYKQEMLDAYDKGLHYKEDYEYHYKKCLNASGLKN